MDAASGKLQTANCKPQIEMDDCEAMAAAARGDDAAFGALVEKYSSPLLNFFLRKGVSYHDGQDLVSRTFLRLWKYRSRYEPAAKFTTFLYLLAGQISVDFFRESARRGRLEDGVAAETALVEERELRGELRPAPCTALDVRKAVAGLPEGLRDVVELGVFQDLPYKEIARILGIPEGTVKSRMHNALRKLKELMA